MKQLTIFVITLLLFTANAGAMANSKSHGAKHVNHHYPQKGYKYGHYKKHNYRYYRPYRGPRVYRSYYRPPYLGAALIGSALRYSLFHTHNGANCYDNHGNDSYQPSSGSYSEVVGCHRMERLPDGTEFRVEVPISECN